MLWLFISEVTKEVSTTQVPISDEITVLAGFEQFDNRFGTNSANINDDFINDSAITNDELLAIETTTTIDRVDNNTKVEMLTSIYAANTAVEPQIFFKSFIKNMTIKICYEVSYLI